MCVCIYYTHVCRSSIYFVSISLRVWRESERKGTEPLHSSLHGLNLTNKHFIAVSCSGCQDLVASTPGTEPLSAGVVRDITVSI